MVRYVMTLILAVGRNMKLTMTLNICLMNLKKILEIKYTYGSLKQPTENIYMMKSNNIYLFIRE